jgi:hypothetical protein
MTLSARSRIERGTVMPSAFAVFKLITGSNKVGGSTGGSAGSAPLSILSINTERRSEVGTEREHEKSPLIHSPIARRIQSAFTSM